MMIEMVLNLDDLDAGMPGIGPKFGAAMAEAAVVCLRSQAHACGVAMLVSGDFATRFTIQWSPPLDPLQAERTWGDPEEATEHGAYGVAALLVSALTGWTVLERARKGAGFDYWLGPKDSSEPLFQGKARLEVSGIRRGSPSEIEGRVNQKVTQITKSSSLTIPGIVAIIEFGTPASRLVNT